MKRTTFVMWIMLLVVAPCYGQGVDVNEPAGLRWSIWPMVADEVAEIRLGATWNYLELYVAPRHDHSLDRYEVAVTDIDIQGFSDIDVDLEAEADIDIVTDIRVYAMYNAVTTEMVAQWLIDGDVTLPEGDFYAGLFGGWAFRDTEWEAGWLLGSRVTLNEHVSWATEYQQCWESFKGDTDRYVVVTGPQFVF